MPQLATPPETDSSHNEPLALLKLAAPLIAAQLALISINVVDTIMSGHVSALDQSAVAQGGSLWVPAYLLTGGALMAMTPTVAHCFGAGQFLEVGRQVRQGLWLALLMSVPCILFMRNCGAIFEWMGVAEEIRPVAIRYNAALAWGVPGIFCYSVLRSLSEGVSQTRPILVISLIGLVCNIILNYILMHGMFGLPTHGAEGCGFASATTMWVMCGCMALWTYWSRHYRSFAPFSHIELPEWHSTATLLRLGMPIGVTLFCETSLFSFVALLMGSIGKEAAAGHQVALSVASVTFMVPFGLSMAVSVRIGQAMGRGAPAAARRTGVVGLFMALGFMSLAALTMVLIPNEIAAAYSTDAAVRAVAVQLLFMAALFQISDGLQVTANSALRGLKDTAWPLAITLIAYWLVGLPLGYVLGVTLQMGPRALWGGLIAGLTVAAILLTTRFFMLMNRLVREQRQI